MPERITSKAEGRKQGTQLMENLAKGRPKGRSPTRRPAVVETRPATQARKEKDEIDDELIEAFWQDIKCDASMHQLWVNSDDELIDDNPDFEEEPKLPGDPTRTGVIMAKVLKEARGRSDDACSDAEQDEAKRRKLAKNQRIQNTGSSELQSGRFEWKVRGVTNLPPTKWQKRNCRGKNP